jgi:hypothetical protein
MNMFPTNEAFKAPLIGSLAVMSGILLCAVGAVGPAFTADLSYDNAPYRLVYDPNSYSRGDYGNSFRVGCYQCSCCGLRNTRTPAAQRFPIEEREPVVVESPVVERFAVVERHWVERDYIKRQNFYYETRYPYPSPYPGRYRYSRYYPPAAVAYEYAAEPRTPHRYVFFRPYEYRPEYEYRPSDEYEASPPPPTLVPSGYYGRSYSE